MEDLKGGSLGESNLLLWWGDEWGGGDFHTADFANSCNIAALEMFTPPSHVCHLPERHFSSFIYVGDPAFHISYLLTNTPTKQLGAMLFFFFIAHWRAAPWCVSVADLSFVWSRYFVTYNLRSDPSSDSRASRTEQFLCHTRNPHVQRLYFKSTCTGVRLCVCVFFFAYCSVHICVRWVHELLHPFSFFGGDPLLV